MCVYKQVCVCVSLEQKLTRESGWVHFLPSQGQRPPGSVVPLSRETDTLREWIWAPHREAQIYPPR